MESESTGEKLPRKIRFFLYISHALSTWGDRMWSFGVGLFMVIVSPESLRVTAVYGLSMGGAILLLGALVGDWVDRTPRLKAARLTLILQNSSVIVCAIIIYVVITKKPQIQAAWPNEGLLTLCYVVIISIAIVAALAGMGTKTAVQKDWIVEICRRDKNMLATMTATLRRIDQFNSLVAPILTGQIMYLASTGIGALFIAGWNLVSVFVEYFLLWKVYSLVPALRRQKGDDSGIEDNQGEEMQALNETAHVGNSDLEGEIQGHSENLDESASNLIKTNQAEIDQSTIENKKSEEVLDTSIPDKHFQSPSSSELQGQRSRSLTAEISKCEPSKQKKSREDKASVVRTMFSGILILYRGWRTYMKYDVAWAGLGLAALYMTVLGFDNITVGYAYTQGINQSIMGILMAAGAVSGISGTFLYPLFRRKIGLERTGLFAFFFEICFLCLCLGSIWAPGSPFDPFLQGWNKILVDSCNTNSSSKFNLPDTQAPLEGSSLVGNLTTLAIEILNSSQTLNTSTQYSGESYRNNGSNSNVTGNDVIHCTGSEESRSPISVWLLMAGIIGARCGLWMADLTISQLFLENIKETERGIVNGVQTSLNTLMDMLKFVLVIIIPQEELYGYLIIVSFAFICLGWVFYARYSHHTRGHLFHLSYMKKCHCKVQENNNTEDVPVT